MVTCFARILSALVMCALGYLGYVLYQQQLAWTVEEKAANNARIWLEMFSETVPEFDMLLQTGSVTQTQIDALRNGKDTLGVFRVKLFDAGGNLVFLSETAGGTAPDVASIDSDYPEAAAAMATGTISVTLRDGSGDPARPGIYAEVYMPVVVGQTTAGLAGIYVDLTKAWAVAEASFARFALLFGGVVLTALLVPTLHWAASWRETHRKNVALQSSTQALHETSKRQAELNEEVALIGDLNEWLQSSRSQAELFEMVTLFLARLMPSSQGEIYVYSEARDGLESCASWGGAVVHAHIHPEDCWGLRRGRTYAYGNARIAFPCNHVDVDENTRYICFPLLAHGETIGLMHLRYGPNVPAAKYDDMRRIAQISAEHIAMALSNVRMRDELQDQSIRDALTGLYNRRHLTTALRRSLAIAARRKTSVGLLSIDVDHFKDFNDRFGHDAGDMVLRAVGEVLDQATDEEELACRPGGEEFMVVLPNTEMADALHRAETIREQIAAIAIRYGETTLPNIAVSVGIALSPEDGKTPQDLMRAADDALYAAKAEGRNRTVLTKLVGFGGAPMRPETGGTGTEDNTDGDADGSNADENAAAPAEVGRSVPRPDREAASGASAGADSKPKADTVGADG